MLATGEDLSLREAADMLGIEPWRLSRLGRFVGIDPSKKCVPRREVQRMVLSPAVDDRYAALREWVLGSLRQQRVT